MKQQIILIISGVLITLIMLEVGLRLYLNINGTEAQKILYVYSRDQIEDEGLRFEGAAYVNYLPNNDHPWHNNLGYRGDEITLPKPDGVYRIVAIGGSTTYGEFLDDNNATYPAQLQQIFRDDYGYAQVEVINAGVPAYTSWENLVNFQFRVLDLEPDLIIIYFGINDLTPRLLHPDDYSGQNRSRGYWREFDGNLPFSALYRFVLVRLGWNPPISDKVESQFVLPDDSVNCGLEFRDDEPYCGNYELPVEAVLDANPPIYFERNIRSIIVLAESYDVDVFLSSWAYSPLEYDVLGGDFLTEPYRQRAVAEHNAIVLSLANAYDLPYYDLEAMMPDEADYWVDGFHQSTLGAETQARLYAEFLIEAGIIPES